MLYHNTSLFSHTAGDPIEQFGKPIKSLQHTEMCFCNGPLSQFFFCIYFIFIVEATQLYHYTPKYRIDTRV